MLGARLILGSMVMVVRSKLRRVVGLLPDTMVLSRSGGYQGPYVCLWS